MDYTDRSEVTKQLRQDLKASTGQTWSVAGGRGTGSNWLTIQAPTARRVMHDPNPNYDPHRNGEFAPIGAETEISYIEREPQPGETAYYTSLEDQEILIKALGISPNFSTCQGVKVSPGMWDFYLDRAKNGPPPPELPEPIQEVAIEENYPQVDAPQNVKVVEVAEPFFLDLQFPLLNKQDTVSGYLVQLENEDDYRTETACVTHTAQLTGQEWDDLSASLLDHIQWLGGKGGVSSTAGLRDVDEFWQYTEEEKAERKNHSYIKVVKVTAPNRRILYIDPQGYSYARYVGFEEESETSRETEALPLLNVAKTLLKTESTPGNVLDTLINTGLTNEEALEIMVQAAQA